MKSSKNIFNRAITDAFTKQPNIKLNADTIGDAIQFQQDMKENKKKIESQEATGASSAGQYSAPLFTKEEETTKEEAKEATTSASSGAYSTPAFIAKNSKNWRGGKKPIYKGGSFVQVKKKCLTFPYCNQGAGAVDYPKKLKESQALKNASERLGLTEEAVLDILKKIYNKDK